MSSNLPESIDPNDRRAPWNEKEYECRYCGDPCDDENEVCEVCKEDIMGDIQYDRDHGK